MKHGIVVGNIAFALTLLGTPATWAANDVGPRFAGEPAGCPTTAPTEVALITYATNTATCATSVSCTNLDKATATITAQFFRGFGNGQAGTDATGALAPGETGEFATQAGDPNGVLGINFDSGNPNFEGKGRICATTKRLACNALLSCNLASGPVMAPIKLVIKKQKGD